MFSRLPLQGLHFFSATREKYLTADTYYGFNLHIMKLGLLSWSSKLYLSELSLELG